MTASVLIVRIGAMGDVLHALPAVAALRRLRPDLLIDWAVDTRWAPLLAGQDGTGPVISHVHLADTRLWSKKPASLATLRSLRDLRQSLRQRRFGHVVDMQGTLRSAVIARFPSAGIVTGYADPKEGPARTLYRATCARRGIHVVEQGTALLGDALGLTLQPEAAALPRDSDAERWADALFDGFGVSAPVALLAPTAGWAAKQWPVENFHALGQELAARGWQVLVNASGPGDVMAAAICAGNRACTVVPCSVAQLVSLVRRVAVLVGGDSGPVHLAAALGRPVVGLYGPTDPARNGPWGLGAKAVLRSPLSQTSYKHTSQPDPGLAAIKVNEVLSAIDGVIAQEKL